MQRADTALRDFLTRPCARPVRFVLFLLFGLCGLLLGLTKSFALATNAGAHLAVAFLMLFPLLLMLLFLFRSRRDAPATQLLLGGTLCLLAMLLRLCFIDRDTGDYEYYLSGWLTSFSGQSFSASMHMQVGEYHVLYQYLLFLTTRLPFPWLYTIKAISFLGDAALAGAALRLTSRLRGRDTGVEGLLVLFLPAVALNGGMFAQCDSLYTACALWGIVFLLENRGGPGLACIALSLCFKLQAVFFFPLLPLFWLAGRCRLRDLLPFFGALILVQLPALLFGKSPSDLIRIYTSQTGLYTGLNYGAPNLFAILTTEGLDAYAYGTFGIGLALAAALLILSVTAGRVSRLSDTDWLRTAALMVTCIVFLLPRMHERYTYGAELLLCLLALADPRAIPAALAASLASLGTLWASALPLPACAFLMLFALLTVLVRFATCLHSCSVSDTDTP